MITIVQCFLNLLICIFGSYSFELSRRLFFPAMDWYILFRYCSEAARMVGLFWIDLEVAAEASTWVVVLWGFRNLVLSFLKFAESRMFKLFLMGGCRMFSFFSANDLSTAAAVIDWLKSGDFLFRLVYEWFIKALLLDLRPEPPCLFKYSLELVSWFYSFI